MTDLASADDRMNRNLKPVIDAHSRPRDVLAALDQILTNAATAATGPATVMVDAVWLRDICNRLETQPTIEQAKGILMNAYRIDAQHAFATMVRWSQTSNTKVRDIACILVDSQPGTQQTPAAIIAAATRTSPNPRHEFDSA